MDEIRYIAGLDRQFPHRLRDIPDAPSGIYFRGRLPDEERPAVAVIGSRNCSEYGRGMAKYFSDCLAGAGVQIISGMARGIDGIAQRAAIDAGGETFGILGCGPDIIYPRENSELFERILEKGGLISEVPPGTPADRINFPKRNRIISGMADILLVIESRIKSGTGITVRYALSQGKDVFAIPGRLTDAMSAGCNRLISEGAGIARDPEDIISALKIRYSAVGTDKRAKKSDNSENLTLAGSEKVVYSLLDLYPKNIDEIISIGRITVPEALEALLDLEIRGLACECGANSYIRKI